MDPYRSSDKPVRGCDWKGLGMRSVTVCWCLALGGGGAFFGLVVGASVTFDAAGKFGIGFLALAGLIGGTLGTW